MSNHEDLTNYSNEELRKQLTEGLTMTAQSLYRLGKVWAELERRGEDLSDLPDMRKGLGLYLPRIAANHLAAEAVVAFIGRPQVLNAIEGLPLQKQKELAAGESIEVIDLTKQGATLTLPLAQLPTAAIKMVFDAGTIRTPAQQRLALKPKKEKEKPKKTARLFKPQYEKGEGLLRIGKMTVKVGDLIKEMAAVNGPELPSLIHANEYVVLRVHLAKEELQALQEAAKKADMNDSEITRKALRAFGLI